MGLRPAHYHNFLTSPPKTVSWVEVISENFMRWENGILPGKPISALESVRKNLPVVLHGVSLSIGSADPLNKLYLKRLKEIVDRIEPSHISDHLCWTGVDGENLHDLLPLPYNSEAFKTVVEKTKKVQDYLGRRILLENPSSYLEFDSGEMTEWEFLAEVAKQADCGILLDINNVYVSSVNHGFDPIKYLNAIPFERVGQIHLAGHSVKNDHLIDTHDEPVCLEVWKLFEWFVKNKGVVSTMIERDDNIPDWSELEKELITAKRILSPKEEGHERAKFSHASKAI